MTHDSTTEAVARRAAPDPRGRLGQRPNTTGVSFFGATFVVFRRQLRLALRNPAWVVIGPVVWAFSTSTLASAKVALLAVTTAAGGSVPSSTASENSGGVTTTSPAASRR